MVVWGSTSECEWLGFHWLQSWFCFVWSETRGVDETVTMMSEAIRKTLFLEPWLLALYVPLFCGLHARSSIQGCIDGWVELERRERETFSFIRHVVLYLNVLHILSENTFGFRTWDLLHKIVKEVVAAGRTALKMLALHQEWPKMWRVLPIHANCRNPLHLEV